MSADTTDTLKPTGSFLADKCVRLVKGVSVFAMRLRGVAFELDGLSAVEVFGVRLGNKVLGVYAGRVPARMADLQPSGYVPMRQLVTETMRQHGPTLTTTQPKVPVTEWQTPAVPFPATVGIAPGYFRPETNLWRTDGHVWPVVDGGVSVTLPSPVMHLTPTTLFGCLSAVGNGAIHMSELYHTVPVET